MQTVPLGLAAPQTVYQHGPQAVLDQGTQRTYAAFPGEDRDLYVTYYDHEAETVATKVLADSRQIAADDAHVAPSIAVAPDGHIHVVWGSHNSAHRHVKSDNPHDISSWTAQDIGTGSYPHIVVDRASGDLYVFDRPGTNHSSSFPSHEYGAVQRSTDDGSTWGSLIEIIDGTGSPETDTDIYLGAVREASDGRFHLAWLTARGTVHDDIRQDVYHAIYDPSDGNLYTAAGDSLGSSITWAEHADCLVDDVEDINKLNMKLDGERVLISYGFRDSGSNASARVAIWDGTSWTVRDTGVPQQDNLASFAAVYPIDDGLRLLVTELVDGDNNVTWWEAPTDGSTWDSLGTVLEETTGEGYVRVSPVPGGGPSVAVAQEDATGQVPTSATSGDLLPLYLIIDPDHSSGVDSEGMDWANNGDWSDNGDWEGLPPDPPPSGNNRMGGTGAIRRKGGPR